MEIIKTEKGRPSLIYEGYRYYISRKTESGIWWRCRVRPIQKPRCKGRIKTSLDYKNVLLRAPHQCTQNDAEVEVFKTKETIKKRIAEELDVPVATIFKEEFNKLSTRGYDMVTMATVMPKYENMKTSLCRIRREALGNSQNHTSSCDGMSLGDNVARLSEDGTHFLENSQFGIPMHSTTENQEYTEFFDSQPHNHPKCKTNVKSLMLRDEILKKAVESDSPPQKIIKEVLENADLDVICELGDMDNLQTQVRRVRKRAQKFPVQKEEMPKKKKKKSKSKKKSTENDECSDTDGQPSTSFDRSQFGRDSPSLMDDDFAEPDVEVMERDSDDDYNTTTMSSNAMQYDDDDYVEVDEEKYLKNIFEAYKSKCQPVQTCARLFDVGGHSYSIVSLCSQKNWSAAKDINIEQTFLTDKALSSPPVCMSTHDVSDEKLIEHAPSRRKAIVREINDGSRGLILEIWNKTHIEKTVDLCDPAHEFGNVYTNDAGRMCWSPCERRIMFLAEKKRPKSKSFLDFFKRSIINNNKGMGHEFDYIDNFGEQLGDVHKPVIVTYDIASDTFSVLKGVPKDIAPFGVIWTPNSDGVIGVGVHIGPNRMGLVDCSNRPSVIFHLSLEGKYTVLSRGKVACNSPRISPSGKYLVWLQRPAHGPHHSAMQLVKFKWDDYYKGTRRVSSTITGNVVIDVVEDSKMTTNGIEFHGLFCKNLPERCFASDSQMFLSTPQRFRNVTYCVNLDMDTVEEIEMEGSCDVMDVFDGNLVMRASKLNKPTELFVAKVFSPEERRMDDENQSDEGSVGALVQLTELPDEAIEESYCYDVRYYKIVTKKTMNIDGKNEEVDSECSVIYYGEMNSALPKSRGLLIFVHDGPHSVSIDAYTANAAMYAELGFNLIFVNFHGSVGFGQRNVDALVGGYGEIDAEDVEHCVSTILSERTEIDPDKIAIAGLSYGGYLSLALSQRSNINIKAVVAKNPVVDLATLPVSSDSPDWPAIETGVPWEGKLSNIFEKQKVINKLSQFSLLDEVQKATAPTLLLAGANDKRVSPAGAIAYYKLLREACIPTKLLMYDDGHPLLSFIADLDSSINSAMWLSRYALRCDT